MSGCEFSLYGFPCVTWMDIGIDGFLVPGHQISEAPQHHPLTPLLAHQVNERIVPLPQYRILVQVLQEHYHPSSAFCNRNHSTSIMKLYSSIGRVDSSFRYTHVHEGTPNCACCKIWFSDKLATTLLHLLYAIIPQQHDSLQAGQIASGPHKMGLCLMSFTCLDCRP